MYKLNSSFALLAFILILPCSILGQNLSVSFVQDTNWLIHKISITGYENSKEFRLYRDKNASNAILGDWVYGQDRLEFTPSLPLDVNYVYQLKFLDASNMANWFPVGIRQKMKIEEPEVIHIYPSAKELPSNLLRFYVEFSMPMQEGNYLEKISLMDEYGTELRGVFLPSRYEYWNKERTKLTMIFDPGRVKTGLRAHQQMGGRALKPGNTYTLTIGSCWKAMNGRPLKRLVSKTFTVTEEIIETIAVQDWKLEKPAPYSQGPLTLGFGRPLDHINARSFIKIIDEYGHLVVGKVWLSQEEARWHFQPTYPWMPGKYQVVVNKKLEDVCGNNLIHGFDVYKASEIARQNEADIETLDFLL